MSDADAILASLAEVARERQRRAADPALGERVRALKQHQQQRLRGTHADLLASPRYRQSALFFLEELYGPADFVQRDAQFARVVPAITRLFPREVVGTVLALAQLHALQRAQQLEGLAPLLEAQARVFIHRFPALGIGQQLGTLGRLQA
ncbi:MAG: hypothetical protein KJ023_22235 [Burkholderiaceae bacterium]|nr:hypothetical protein [Burkholderiaceae bacterium]